MDPEKIEKEFRRLGAGQFIPSAFIDHVRNQQPRPFTDCLDDLLPIPVTRIEIPDFAYDLEERWQATRRLDPSAPTTRPQTSFVIDARTWRDLADATRLFVDVAVNFDLYPTSVLVEDNVAIVCCDT